MIKSRIPSLLSLLLLLFMSNTVSSQSGLQNNQLKPCPDSPNCICSEQQSEHALPFQQYGIGAIRSAIEESIIQQGGKIIKVENDYFHAEYTSKWFKFVDDLEVRIDQDKQMAHFRSASRTGYYDFGVNQKRIEELKKLIILSLTRNASNYSVK